MSLDPLTLTGQPSPQTEREDHFLMMLLEVLWLSAVMPLSLQIWNK